MYITLYIISPICNVKELIMDKPHKECGIATVELIKALTYKETVVINRWEN